MQVQETYLKGSFILKPTIFTDERGYFFESYNLDALNKLANIHNNFVQDNQSYSVYGTIRGLHYQSGKNAQAKLVRVIEGTVLDVAVDLRINSPTYGRWYSVELSGDNNLQFYIPRGFAHGFSVLSDKALFVYKCDNYYNQKAESGIIYNDSKLNIDWKIPKSRELVSKKDRELPIFDSKGLIQ